MPWLMLSSYCSGVSGAKQSLGFSALLAASKTFHYTANIKSFDLTDVEETMSVYRQNHPLLSKSCLRMWSRTSVHILNLLLLYKSKCGFFPKVGSGASLLCPFSRAPIPPYLSVQQHFPCH